MVDNQTLYPLDSLSLIERYFKDNFKDFVLLEKTNYTGYWWLEYSNGHDVKVCFDGDIGGHFSVKIFIGDSENYLWQFDRSVNNSTHTTRKNILYQLNILNIFFIERAK